MLVSFGIKNGIHVIAVLNCAAFLVIIITQTNLLPAALRLSAGQKPGHETEATPSTKTARKSEVLLVVVVSSAPSRRARRDAIRSTYWKHCHNDTKVCTHNLSLELNALLLNLC